MDKVRNKAVRSKWNELYQLAEAQAGHFTLSQAEDCGYSSQHLQKHLAAGRVGRIRRGIYRLVHFPYSENEELVVFWLWSDKAGVFSHETSLLLHGLTDALPAQVHMSLPLDWATRRMRIPQGLHLHYEDIAEEDWTWHEAVPLTTPRQALAECIDDHVSPDLLEQGILQARTRGLITKRESTRLEKRRNQEVERPA